MEDELIKEEIYDNCHPVSHADIFRILSAFEILEYDVITNRLYDIVNLPMDGRPDNYSFLLIKTITNSAFDVLDEMGLILDREKTKLNEISSILMSMATIMEIDYSIAVNLVSSYENVDDQFEVMSDVISSITDIGKYRVFDIIDEVRPMFSKKVKEVLDTIVNTIDESEDITQSIIDSRKANVMIKLLRFIDKDTKDHKILGLVISVDGMILDIELSKLMEAYFDNISHDPREAAFDIISLILISKDQRFNMLDAYIEIVEDIIENENDKAIVYNIVKSKVESIYSKLKDLDKYNVFSKEA